MDGIDRRFAESGNATEDCELAVLIFRKAGSCPFFARTAARGCFCDFRLFLVNIFSPYASRGLGSSRRHSHSKHMMGRSVLMIRYGAGLYRSRALMIRQAEIKQSKHSTEEFSRCLSLHPGENIACQRRQTSGNKPRCRR